MKITFFSAFPDAVIGILLDEARLCSEEELARPAGSYFTIKQATDTAYIAWTQWLSAAIGCGLISKPEIERN